MTAIFDAISEPIAKRVTAGLAKIGVVLRSNAWKGAGTEKVTPTQAHVLALLRESSAGMRLGEVAKLLGVSAPTASDAVSSLVGKGLVEKAAGENKRSISLVLTPAGREIAERTQDWPSFLATAVDTLEPGEQAVLLRSLVKVVRALQTQNEIPHQRMCVTCSYFRPNVHDDGANPHHCAFVDAPFGDRHLRFNCPEHDEAPAGEQEPSWKRFIADRPGSASASEQRP